MKKLSLLFIILLFAFNYSYSQSTENADNKIQTVMIYTDTYGSMTIILPNNEEETYKLKGSSILLKEKLDYWLNKGYKIEGISSRGERFLVIVLVKEPSKQ